MTPRHATIDTSTLGKVTLVAAGDAMTGLFFERHRPKPKVSFGRRVEVEREACPPALSLATPSEPALSWWR